MSAARIARSILQAATDGPILDLNLSQAHSCFNLELLNILFNQCLLEHPLKSGTKLLNNIQALRSLHLGREMICFREPEQWEQVQQQLLQRLQQHHQHNHHQQPHQHNHHQQPHHHQAKVSQLIVQLFPNLHSLGLGATASHFTMFDLQILSCHHLQALDLSHCQEINNAALHILAHQCRQLESLNLSFCFALDNEGLSYFLAQAGHSLRQLFLEQLEDISLEAFDNFGHQENQQQKRQKNQPQLQQQTVSGLQLLDLSRCPRFLDEDIAACAQKFGGTLRVLHLKGPTGLTDQGLEAIAQECFNLHTMSLDNQNHITNLGVQKVMAGCEQLRWLGVKFCGRVVGEGGD
eukprot:m.14641 g.14641  ORF g.14641 m.14641 type:complete len:349 (-) comp9229_c0_seq2:51-1097(-)